MKHVHTEFLNQHSEFSSREKEFAFLLVLIPFGEEVFNCKYGHKAGLSSETWLLETHPGGGVGSYRGEGLGRKASGYSHQHIVTPRVTTLSSGILRFEPLSLQNLSW